MTPFYRVDNRLVHGQILSTWLPHLRLARFVVACDQVPLNELQCAMFRMAMPAGVSFDALTVDDAIAFLNEKRYGDDRTMVLLESIEDAVRMFDTGHRFTQLNIGNLHHTPGAKAITNAVYVTPAQKAALQQLAKRGVLIEVQSLPMETAIILREH